MGEKEGVVGVLSGVKMRGGEKERRGRVKREVKVKSSQQVAQTVGAHQVAVGILQG